MLILWFFLTDGTSHASISDVFGATVNNTGLFGGKTSGAGFLLYILPLSGILTQYTITGYDASAHLSEETQAASSGCGQGHLAVDLLLRHRWLDPAAVVPVRRAGQGRRHRTAGGSVFADLRAGARPRTWPGFVVAISAAGQFFCTVACMTSTSRMFFAFSRDGAMPGREALRQAERQPGARPTP